ncbi:MAG: 30S ribosomal protein S2, partial [Desulfobacterales bacterium]|nr:30S ribosomal protein S2 [Desulfobacterales bacterium]
YPIPANDDSMKTISLIVNYIADAIVETIGDVGEDEPTTEDLDRNSIEVKAESNFDETDKLESDQVHIEQSDEPAAGQ